MQHQLRWMLSALSIGLLSARAAAQSDPRAPDQARVCELEPVLGVTTEADVRQLFGRPSAVFVQQSSSVSPVYVDPDDPPSSAPEARMRVIAYFFGRDAYYYYFAGTDQLVAPIIVVDDQVVDLPACWQDGLYAEPVAYGRANQALAGFAPAADPED